ncbi:MAG: heat-inducible transcriptional repressor HrcA [Synergistaceae bacterium]|jgi:heat-inducible transcriptional repressor|nr:heat-inducible transcriptional repressor HrcA [Synergistaceae bacterium]
MLTERHLEVLLSVVHEFIESGEHVGSRTLSRRYLTGRSAATIRNEMADLEEMGYLMQPHTSAGRAPTTRAYRLFVDTVLQRRSHRDLDRGEWVEHLKAHRNGLQGALTNATELLTQLSNYVGVAAFTQLKQARLSKIDFIRVDTSHVLLLLVLEGGIVHHRIITMPYDLPQESLEDLTRRINTLAGHAWNEVRILLHGYIAQELGGYADSCRKAIDEMDRLLAAEHTTLFTGSLSNLFSVPDFQNIARFRALFSILEQESELVDLLRKYSRVDGIGVIIGEEHDVPELENCAVVFSSSSTEGQRTTLGIIGPKRMNYEKVISVLDRVLHDMTELPDDSGSGANC